MRGSATSSPPDAPTRAGTAAVVEEYGPLGAALYDAWQVRRPHDDWTVYARILRPISGRVLDLGAGTGRLLEQLWQSGYDADGVDHSIAMAARFARRRTTSRGTYVVADFRELIPLRGYDAALCSRNTLAHLSTHEELTRVLTRLAGALRAGGVAIIDLDCIKTAEPFVESGDQILTIDGVELSFRHHCSYDPRRGRAWFSAVGNARTMSGCEQFRIRSTTLLWSAARFVAAASVSGFRVAETVDAYGAGVVEATKRHSRMYVLERQ